MLSRIHKAYARTHIVSELGESFAWMGANAHWWDRLSGLAIEFSEKRFKEVSLHVCVCVFCVCVKHFFYIHEYDSIVLGWQLSYQEHFTSIGAFFFSRCGTCLFGYLRPSPSLCFPLLCGNDFVGPWRPI